VYPKWEIGKLASRLESADSGLSGANVLIFSTKNQLLQRQRFGDLLA
jgi:hypothetical protein